MCFQRSGIFFFLGNLKEGVDKRLTPTEPSLRISLPRFTSPYAPLPISPSIRNSDMLLLPRKDWCSLGEGARVLADMLRKLPVLSARLRL